MDTRKTEIIVPPKKPHFVGDGFRVHNFIPSNQRLDMERMDPFILLDYNSKYEFPPSDKPRGVDVHPHRGFETVTIAYNGKIAHHDSSGGGGVIGEGDVQWMTAGSGILHKEYHEENFSKEGGPFQMVQLWVNLPAKYKMTDPKYQSIKNEQIPRISLPDEAGTIEVIAGEYEDTEGAASTFSPINLFNVKLNKGADTTFTFPGSYNTALLVVEGSVKVNGEEHADTDHFVLFENSEGQFSVEAEEQAVVLVMSGEPLQEPIAAQGPFVMNTQEELVQAIRDYNSGKFGAM